MSENVTRDEMKDLLKIVLEEVDAKASESVAKLIRPLAARYEQLASGFGELAAAVHRSRLDAFAMEAAKLILAEEYARETLARSNDETYKVDFAAVASAAYAFAVKMEQHAAMNDVQERRRRELASENKAGAPAAERIDKIIDRAGKIP